MNRKKEMKRTKKMEMTWEKEEEKLKSIESKVV